MCWAIKVNTDLSQMLSTAPWCWAFVAAASSPCVGFIHPWVWGLQEKEYNFHGTWQTHIKVSALNTVKPKTVKKSRTKTSYYQQFHSFYYLKPDVRCTIYTHRPSLHAYRRANELEKPKNCEKVEDVGDQRAAASACRRSREDGCSQKRPCQLTSGTVLMAAVHTM